jgi:hypothetical protein
MRRSTVLSLPLQLVFLGLTVTYVKTKVKVDVVTNPQVNVTNLFAH